MTRVREDVLGLHESLLGRKLTACISETKNADLYIDDTNARFLQDLQRVGVKVVVSFFGTLGDPGTVGTLHRLFTRGRTFERLTRSGSTYPSSLTTHEVLKTAVGSLTSIRFTASLTVDSSGKALDGAELCDDLLGRVSFLLHDVASGLEGATPTYDLDWFIGGIPLVRAV